MSLALVLSILFLTTNVYAVLLHRTQGRGIEPAYTWLKVAGGSSLCLIAGGVYIGTNTITAWGAYEAMWACFIVGGTPIVAWQIGLDIHRRQRELRTMQRIASLRDQRHETTSAPSPAARRQADG